MAELTTTDPTPTGSCCAPPTQATCCEPADKATCCGPEHEAGTCGCSASSDHGDDVRERVRERYAAAATAASHGGGCCSGIEAIPLPDASVDVSSATASSTSQATSPASCATRHPDPRNHRGS